MLNWFRLRGPAHFCAFRHIQLSLFIADLNLYLLLLVIFIVIAKIFSLYEADIEGLSAIESRNVIYHLCCVMAGPS